MEYGDFVDRSEIFERKRKRELEMLRMIVGAQVGQDPRKIIPLPGDWDHVPKLMSKEESMKILAKHGFDKVLNEISQKAKQGKA